MRTNKMAFSTLLLMIFTLAFSACGENPAPPPEAVPLTPTTHIPLAIGTEFSRLDIPENNRPNGAKPPLDIPIGVWRLKGKANAKKSNHSQYVTRIPIRPRGLFYAKPPEGSFMTGPNNERIPHIRHRTPSEPYWTYDRSKLNLFLPQGSAKPSANEYSLRYPVALAREAALNYEFSGAKSPEEFVRTQVQSGRESLSGLLLPAPGVVEWNLELPANPTLEMSVGLVPPEIFQANESDGASVHLTVINEGKETNVWSQVVEAKPFNRVSVALSEFGGKSITLRLESKPNGTSDFDYVFINDPAIVETTETPRRVYLIFVDTVRVDHLNLFGYDRETSPSLNKLAENATVFESARSVAPWTLPSTRAALTGRHPEYFDASQTLPRYVREKGWASAMFAGNLYLAPNFGLHRDWGLQNVVLWPTAADIVDRGLDFIDANPNRSTLILLQFMDAHLPYKEPKSHRRIFAGEPRGGLGEEFHRSTIVRARLKTEEDRQYVIDRYDNNIRYINDELERLYSRLGPNDIVVYFSDHGEEFWDHNSFEHGHSLYDELLRVPLVIRGPGMKPGRISEPVSLLDITPTVLDLLEIERPKLDGMSLVKASQNDPASLKALADRNLTFGRPLYGYERWGVLHNNQKYTTTEGREELYDLSKNTLESQNLLKGADGAVGSEYRDYMGDGLGRQVSVVYRLAPSYMRGGPQNDFVITMTVPGGVDIAWVGDDPTRSSSASIVVDDETVTATWHKSFHGSREVYVKPTLPMDQVTHQLTLSGEFGSESGQMTIDKTASPILAENRQPLGKLTLGKRSVSIGFAISPIPNAETQALSGYDPELASMLQAMGYAVGDEEDIEEQEEDAKATE